MLRQVIVSLFGNIDVGKSQTIDRIKKTLIVQSEPGKITQSIKAYSISLNAIKDICKDILDMSKMKIPGLLFIDLPGHKAFSNLRKRGGSLADIAVLVVDINEGLKPQTIEAIEILKENKTPFVIALNKVDLLNGWQTNLEIPMVKSINSQAPSVQKLLDDKLYKLVGDFYAKGLSTERFDRVEDFTKQIVMIPMSAKTGEGIPELLMLITGLAQRFLENELSYDSEVPAEGTILEITEEKGLGLCMDTIIYKGKLKVNDTIVVGTLQEPIATKVKALFLVEKNQLKNIKEAEAAIGVKILALNTEHVVPGMPLKVANKDLEKTKVEIKKQVEEITLELDQQGIVVKADSLGSLEALINLLREKGVKVKRASIGDISKKDIAEAVSSVNQLQKIILGFNVKQVDSDEVKIITNNVIYSLIDRYDEWYNSEKKAMEEKIMGNIPKPCKIKILEGYVFRQSNPAVCGVEVIAGLLKNGINLMKDGQRITEVKELQNEGKKVSEAKRGEQIAVSMPGVTIGRQLKDGDVLYSDLTEDQFRVYKKMRKFINDEEVEILKEIADLKRKTNPGWGI